MEVAVATSTYVFQVISADSGFLLKIGANFKVTGRDVYGPVVGRWLCNDNRMRLTVMPKGGVKMVYPISGGITVSCQCFLHGFILVWVFVTMLVLFGWLCSYYNKCCLWMMLFW